MVKLRKPAKAAQHLSKSAQTGEFFDAAPLFIEKRQKTVEVDQKIAEKLSKKYPKNLLFSHSLVGSNIFCPFFCPSPGIKFAPEHSRKWLEFESGIDIFPF